MSILIAFCYAELASRLSRSPAATTRWSAAPSGPPSASPSSSSAWSPCRSSSRSSPSASPTTSASRSHGLDPRLDALVVIVLATVTACLEHPHQRLAHRRFLFIEMAALGPAHRARFRPHRTPADRAAQTRRSSTQPPAGWRRWAIAGLVIAVTQGIFAYNGYGGAVYFAEETKNAARTIARAVHLERRHHRRSPRSSRSPRSCSAPLAWPTSSARSLPGRGVPRPSAPVMPSRSSSCSRSRWPSSTPSSPSPCSPAGCLYAAARDQRPPARPSPRRCRPSAPRRRVPSSPPLVMGAIAVRRVLRPDGRAAQRHRIDPGLQLPVHRAGGDQPPPQRRAGRGYRMPLWPLPPDLHRRARPSSSS